MRQIVVFLGLFLVGFGVQAKCVEIVEGTEFCEPFQFQSAHSEMVNVYGLVDYIKLSDQIKKYGLRPIQIGKKSGLLMLSGIEYLKSDIGPYRESVVGVVVQASDHPQIRYDSTMDFLLNPPATSIEKPVWGIYFIELTLDGDHKKTVEIAVKGGRKLLSLPKEAGRVWISSEYQSNKYEVSNYGPGYRLFVDVGDAFEFYKVQKSASYHMISINSKSEVCFTYVRQRMRVFADGFDGNDKIWYTGWMKKYLEGLGFRPSIWSENEDVSTVIYRKEFCP